MLSSGQVLQHRYRIERRVGYGGIGAVYAATDLRLAATVAVKQITPGSAAIEAAFEREARLLAALRHQALPRVGDHFTDEAGQFLVMDFVPGPDLAEQSARRGQPFPVVDVLAWADQLLDALAYLHSREPPVLHRDIKPSNLKLTADGRIMLLDFGLAKGTIGHTQPGGSLVGYTLRYAPLEQIRGEGTDPRSDLYSLAATLYDLLTARPPADALQRATARVDDQPDPLTPADLVNPLVPPAVAAVLQDALALSPARRPADATAMRVALARASGDAATLSPDRAAPPAVTSATTPPVVQPAEPPAVASPVAEASPRGMALSPVRRPATRLLGAGVAAIVVVAMLAFLLPRLWPAVSGPAVPASGDARPGATASPSSSLLAASSSPPPPAVGSLTPAAGGAVAGSAGPTTGHPRLWLRATDVPRLRAWAVDSNPVFKDGLAVLAAKARREMDAGLVPGSDSGDPEWSDYPSERYAQLFAFMSLVVGDQAERDDYARRARTLLMHVIGEAAKGPATGQPFRDERFAVGGRSQLWGEGFALTVDWIYPTLSAADKTAIRDVFARWSGELMANPQLADSRPEPAGMVNSRALLSDRDRVRRASAPAYAATTRNLGLMALALDPADDPEGKLDAVLRQATGAWLYVADDLLRTDARGGFLPDNFEDLPRTTGALAQFLLALHTAGRADPAVLGPQVVLAGQPFWDELVAAYLHSLNPLPPVEVGRGQVEQPAWYGDASVLLAPDFIAAFGPVGVHDALTGSARRLSALRWIQINLPTGGPRALASARVADSSSASQAILYFLLIEPGAPPTDPRPGLPLTHVAAGMGRLLARTGWGDDARWFAYGLGCRVSDRQHGDGNQIEFYRRGEWLTKERAGSGPNIASADYHNTLALQNDAPQHNAPDDYRHIIWQRGSQWLNAASGDGRVLAASHGPGYAYALGDATALYNSANEQATDIVHVSRSVVWLAPDHIVVYDRAASRTAGRFKRFWLQAPTLPAVAGNRATVTTAGGQRLTVTTLLPADAAIAAEAAEPLDSEPADKEPMRFRLRVEAPGGPTEARFLHVLQGADIGAPADPAALIQGAAGAPYVGAAVRGVVVLFPVTLSAEVTGLTYLAPGGVTAHVITGLTPNARYDATLTPDVGGTRVQVAPGAAYQADAGGVLILGRLNP